MWWFIGVWLVLGSAIAAWVYWFQIALVLDPVLVWTNLDPSLVSAVVVPIVLMVVGGGALAAGAAVADRTLTRRRGRRHLPTFWLLLGVLISGLLVLGGQMDLGLWMDDAAFPFGIVEYVPMPRVMGALAGVGGLAFVPLVIAAAIVGVRAAAPPRAAALATPRGAA